MNLVLPLIFVTVGLLVSQVKGEVQAQTIQRRRHYNRARTELSRSPSYPWTIGSQSVPILLIANTAGLRHNRPRSIVSILTRPSGRMQRSSIAQNHSAITFQSSPGLLAGCNTFDSMCAA